MGFFDRFRKRVQEVADETDLDELTAEEGLKKRLKHPGPQIPNLRKKCLSHLKKLLLNFHQQS